MLQFIWVTLSWYFFVTWNNGRKGWNWNFHTLRWPYSAFFCTYVFCDVTHCDLVISLPVVHWHPASNDSSTLEVLIESTTTALKAWVEMLLEAELSTDIVTVIPSIDSSKHWSKIARDRIRLGADNIRSSGFFYGIPLHLISHETKSNIRNKVCAQLRILDLRRWSGNGYYSHRSGSKILGSNDWRNFSLIIWI